MADTDLGYDSGYDTPPEINDYYIDDIVRCDLCQIQLDHYTNYLCEHKFHHNCIRRHEPHCPICHNMLRSEIEYIYPIATNINYSKNFIVGNGLIPKTDLTQYLSNIENNTIFNIRTSWSTQGYDNTSGINDNKIVMCNNIDELYRSQKELNTMVNKVHTIILSKVNIAILG